MKNKKFLTICICLSCFLITEAQINASTANQSTDSLDVLVFRRMVEFISADFFGVKNSKPIEDAMKVNSGEHQLYMPVHGANPGIAPPETNNSYDNFLPTVYVKEALQGSPF